MIKSDEWLQKNSDVWVDVIEKWTESFNVRKEIVKNMYLLEIYIRVCQKQDLWIW
jgi:hypothetical protein